MKFMPVDETLELCEVLPTCDPYLQPLRPMGAGGLRCLNFLNDKIMVVTV